MTNAIPVGDIPRSQYLGGSDAAAIMGVGGFGQTPTTVWLRKTGGSDEDISDALEKFFRRRKAMEPVVARMLEEDYSLVVHRLSMDDNPNRYLHPQHPFIAAEIDGECMMNEALRERFGHLDWFAAIPDDTVINLEVKTVHPFKAYEWGEEGTEEVPIHYAAQAMHGLAVTGRECCLVAALIGIDALLVFPIRRDEEVCEGMIAKEVVFWNEHVLTGIPPAPVNIDDIKMLYTDMKIRTAEITHEHADKLRERSAIAKQIKELEDRRDEIEFQVASHIVMQWGYRPDQIKEPEDAKVNLTIDGKPAGSWNRQEAVWLDQKRLKQAHPEIISEFTAKMPYRIFRLKTSKEK